MRKRPETEKEGFLVHNCLSRPCDACSCGVREALESGENTAIAQAYRERSATYRLGLLKTFVEIMISAEVLDAAGLSTADEMPETSTADKC